MPARTKVRTAVDRKGQMYWPDIAGRERAEEGHELTIRVKSVPDMNIAELVVKRGLQVSFYSADKLIASLVMQVLPGGADGVMFHSPKFILRRRKVHRPMGDYKPEQQKGQ